MSIVRFVMSVQYCFHDRGVMEFDKMQIIFKAIPGSSSHAFWWEGTVLHSMETLFDAGLGKYISLGKGTYHGMLRCLAKRTSQGSDQLHGFCDRFFSHSYSAALSFPPRGVIGTSCYHFEYDLHLIKIPSHLDRESIYTKLVYENSLFKSCVLSGR